MRRQRGFTYLIMLFFVAITAAGLAALGQRWSTAAQREREEELVFRGNEIARAIASYAAASPVQQARQYPRTLDDLLNDRRSAKTRHHLRRLYVDPFTQAADWVLVPDPVDPARFSAVHSRSEHALLRTRKEDGTPVKQARDWAFSAQQIEFANAPASAPASSPASGNQPL